MIIDAIYCHECGYEDFDETGNGLEIEYIRTVANGDVYQCPACKGETMNVDEIEDEHTNEKRHAYNIYYGTKFKDIFSQNLGKTQ